MDHQAVAQLLGNYGEFVGAIAVLVTLVYLAFQVRQNNVGIMTAAESAAQLAMQQAHLNAATSNDLMDAVMDSLNNELEEILPRSYLQYDTWLVSLLTVLQTQHSQATRGVGDPQVLATAGYLIQRTFAFMRQAPRVWDRFRIAFSAEFQTFIDDLVGPTNEQMRVLRQEADVMSRR